MIVVDETIPVGEPPPPFPKKEVKINYDEDMRQHYDLKKEIGRGRFGTVYLCTCKTTGLKFAAKFVNTKRNQDRQNVEREIELMKLLNTNRPHPKLIQLYDAFDMGKEMCLVLEVVDGGELFERVIDDDFILTERACAIFIRQICEGIEYIHSQNVLHLDMKPENILCLSRQGNRVKICDFGLARKYDPRKKLQVLFGTPEFVAPEVVNFDPIGYGTDLWSVGVICYVLISGLSPFMGHNYVETMTNVTHNKYDFNDEAFDDVSDDVIDFIEKLLVLDKCERMTPDQCLRHKWMKNMLSNAPTKSCEVEEKEIAISDKDNNNPIAIVDEIGTTQTDNVILVNKCPSVTPDIKNKDDPQCTAQTNIPIASKSPISPLVTLENSQQKCTPQKLDSFHKVSSRQSTEGSLDTAKKQMKEFVERWNSHPSSPYLIGSPTIPSHIHDRALSENWDSSISSFDSLEAPLPSNEKAISCPQKTIKVETKEEAIPVVSKSPISAEYQVAKELEKSLAKLKEEATTVSPDPITKTEVPLSKTEAPKLRRQEAIKDIPKDGMKSLEKDAIIKWKPSRDVPMTTEKKVTSNRTTPERTILSPSSITPLRRSRRTSKDEGTIFKDPVNQAYSHRRPSRDVPSAVVTGRLNGVLSPELIKAPNQEIWPDAFCISQDKDSDEDMPQPITGKLELPIVMSPQQKLGKQSSDCQDKRQSFSVDKSKSLDEHGLYKVEHKRAAWVLNMGTSVDTDNDDSQPVVRPSSHNLIDSPQQSFQKSTLSINNKNTFVSSDLNNQPGKVPSSNIEIKNTTVQNKDIKKPNEKPNLVSKEIKPVTDKKESANEIQNTKSKQNLTRQDEKLLSDNKKASNEEQPKENSIQTLQDVKPTPDNKETSHEHNPKDSGRNTNKSPICITFVKKDPQADSSSAFKTKNNETSISSVEKMSNKNDEKTAKPKTNLSSQPFEKMKNENTKNFNQSNNEEQENISRKEKDNKAPSRTASPKPSSAKKVEEVVAKTKSTNESSDISHKDKINDTKLSAEKANLPKPISNSPVKKLSSRNNSGNKIKSSLTPRSSGELDRPGSANLKPSDSLENLETVSTPWGPMRRSPSKGNIKSAEKGVIIINLADSPSDKKKTSTTTKTEIKNRNSFLSTIEKTSKDDNKTPSKDFIDKEVTIPSSKSKPAQHENPPLQKATFEKVGDTDFKSNGKKPVLKKSVDRFSYTERKKNLSESEKSDSKVNNEESIVPIKIDISYEEIFNDPGTPKFIVKKKSLPIVLSQNSSSKPPLRCQSNEKLNDKELRSTSPSKFTDSPPKAYMITRKNSGGKSPSPLRTLSPQSNSSSNITPPKEKVLDSKLNSPSKLTLKTNLSPDNKLSERRSNSPNISPGLKNSATIGGGINQMFLKSQVNQKDEPKNSKKDTTFPNAKLPPKPQDVTLEDSKAKLTRKKSVADTDKEDEIEGTNLQRRKSRSSQSPSGKGSFRMSLYSAQDRISLFETKQDDPNPRTFRPISRSKTSTVLSDQASNQPNHTSNRSSFYEKTKPHMTNTVYTRV